MRKLLSIYDTRLVSNDGLCGQRCQALITEVAEPFIEDISVEEACVNAFVQWTPVNTIIKQRTLQFGLP